MHHSRLEDMVSKSIHTPTTCRYASCAAQDQQTVTSRLLACVVDITPHTVV